MDDDDAPAALVRGHAGKIGQAAYLIDGNLLAGFLAGFGFFAFQAQRFRLQQLVVGVGALPEPVARRALAAGETGCIRMLAQQALAEPYCQVELADAFDSLEQDAIRGTPEQFLQARPVILLPRIDRVHAHSVAMMPSSCCFTFSSGCAPSITA